MRSRSLPVFAAVLFASALAMAKGKEKAPFPPAILAARTVSVVIDRDSGMAADDPFANQTARKDVETALANWGRFETKLAGQPADLIIVVRRGQKQPVEQTFPDPRQNDRTGAINPLDNGIQTGARQGQPVDPASGRPVTGNTPSTIQTEIGSQEDSFLVYNGTGDHPLDAPPLWRYIVTDGLRPHSVPAVNEFRKAVANAEKAAAQKKP